MTFRAVRDAALEFAPYAEVIFPIREPFTALSAVRSAVSTCDGALASPKFSLGLPHVTFAGRAKGRGTRGATVWTTLGVRIRTLVINSRGLIRKWAAGISEDTVDKFQHSAIPPHDCSDNTFRLRLEASMLPRCEGATCSRIKIHRQTQVPTDTCSAQLKSRTRLEASSSIDINPAKSLKHVPHRPQLLTYTAPRVDALCLACRTPVHTPRRW